MTTEEKCGYCEGSITKTDEHSGTCDECGLMFVNDIMLNGSWFKSTYDKSVMIICPFCKRNVGYVHGNDHEHSYVETVDVMDRTIQSQLEAIYAKHGKTCNVLAIAVNAAIKTAINENFVAK